MALLDSLPTPVLFILAIVIPVGITLAFVRIFHSRAVALSYDPPAPKEDDGTPRPGLTWDLSSRVISISMFAFVFLLAFTIAQFWGNFRDAQVATQSEAGAYTRAYVLAQSLPPEQRDVVVAGLDQYRATVTDVQWPLLEAADASAAYAVQTQASTALSQALQEAAAMGAGDAPTAAGITSAVDAITAEGTDRVFALPEQSSLSLIALISFLGLTMLILICVFQTARLPIHLLLTGIAAAILGVLLFSLVQLSNPYGGGFGIQPMLGTLPL